VNDDHYPMGIIPLAALSLDCPVSPPSLSALTLAVPSLSSPYHFVVTSVHPRSPLPFFSFVFLSPFLSHCAGYVFSFVYVPTPSWTAKTCQPMWMATSCKSHWPLVRVASPSLYFPLCTRCLTFRLFSSSRCTFQSTMLFLLSLSGSTGLTSVHSIINFSCFVSDYACDPWHNTHFCPFSVVSSFHIDDLPHLQSLPLGACMANPTCDTFPHTTSPLSAKLRPAPLFFPWPA